MSKPQDFSSEESSVRIALPPSRGAVLPPPSPRPPIVKPKQLSESSFEESESIPPPVAISQEPRQFSPSDTEIFAGIEAEVAGNQGEESQPFLVYLVLATSLVALGMQIWMLF